MALDNLSDKDKEFLAKLELELKDRYTEKDEEFMKIFNMAPSVPPIVENWWVPNNSGGRRNNRFNPYNRYDRDNRGRGYQDRRTGGHRGYNDYNRGHNDNQDYRNEHSYRRRY